MIRGSSGADYACLSDVSLWYEPSCGGGKGKGGEMVKEAQLRRFLSGSGSARKCRYGVICSRGCDSG